MATRFCKSCYDKHMERMKEVAKQIKGGDKRIVVHAGSMSFRCKTPIYSTGPYGDYIVSQWDCKENREKTYMLEDYKRMVRDGEL